eukprot:6471685-Amphidinium_carterae.5
MRLYYSYVRSSASLYDKAYMTKVRVNKPWLPQACVTQGTTSDITLGIAITHSERQYSSNVTLAK